jgi:hypothetical protein
VQEALPGFFCRTLFEIIFAVSVRIFLPGRAENLFVVMIAVDWVKRIERGGAG